MPDDHSQSVYELVGGEEWFVALVDRFYDAVERDLVLRPMYPDDLGESRRRLAGFLSQYWGGPPHYSEERGHPRLRMRHASFPIGDAERAAWMRHMAGAVRAAAPAPEIETAMLDYFERSAAWMVNQPG